MKDQSIRRTAVGSLAAVWHLNGDTNSGSDQNGLWWCKT